MKSSYQSSEAKKIITRYRKLGVNKDVALRVYTTQLLGSDSSLVLHGGGNTSVKTIAKDSMNRSIEVLCVKGSGWDMGNIEPEGLPAVRLNQLLELRNLDSLSDEDMVNFQRAALLNSSSPNPSVETLLHAFLPHKFIDHTHSTAVLSITDQVGDIKVLKEVYGDRVALVPYVKPGFDLAVSAARIFDLNKDVEGLILRKHGIFTFGSTALESYERMIELVTLAEKRILKGKRKKFSSIKLPKNIASVSEISPILRGSLSIPPRDSNLADPKRMVLAFRTNSKILKYVSGSRVANYSQVGVVTPDHTIRTKNWPLIVMPPTADSLTKFSQSVTDLVTKFSFRYKKYFDKHNGKRDSEKIMLDPYPRVVLVPGVGLFGVGRSLNAANIAADIAENTVRVIADAESIGRYRPVNEADMFDVEYWSLEQAKLGKASEPHFSGQVVLVTGGGSGIGAATVREFAKQGAVVAVIDSDRNCAESVSKSIGTLGLSIACDVTSPNEVRAAFDRVCENFGGVDIVVSNAGAAWQGSIAEIDENQLRDSFELNFFSHQTVAQNAVRVMKLQGTGGALLFNASKQSVNPGPDFGPYGLPKAATLFLSKQYALECGSYGITSNAVNADRVNTGIFSGGFLEKRAKARGLTPEEYLRKGNLLQREVKAEDVAQAFVDLARARKTTGATITVDGGNIAASMR